MESFTDFTSQRENVQQVNEDLFTILLNCKDYAAMVFDVAGNVVSWNPATEHMFGFSAGDLAGKNIDDFYTEELQQDGFCTAIKTAKEKGRYEYEGWQYKKDGTKFFAAICMLPLYNEDRSLKGFAKTFRNITIQKELEEKNRLLTEQLTQKCREQEKELNRTNKTENNPGTTPYAFQQALNDLNRIMDSSLDIICSIDEQGRFVNVSSVAERILGYSSQELTGMKYMNLVWQEDIEYTIKAAANIKQGFPVTMFQNRYVHKNGSIVSLVWSAKWDANDKLMYCIAKDAREKKKLEEAIEYERSRFEDLFFQAPSSIGIFKGPGHVFEMANSRYLKLTGKKDIIGKTVREAFPEIEGQGLFEVLDEVYSTGTSFSAYERQIKVDREGTGILTDIYLNFIYQAYKNKEGEVEGIFFFANDVTEQVEARKKTIHEKANLQAILSTTNIGYTLLDKDLNIVVFNQAANNWGVDKFQSPLVAGVNYLHFVKDDKVDFVRQRMQQVLSGKSHDLHLKIPVDKGTFKWYFMRINPIVNGDRIEGICIATEEITKDKEAEIEKEQITSDLIQRNKDMEQFNYIVSHNLRSHVANISGICDILNTDTDIADSRELFWSELCNSVEKLDTVLKDLNTILQVKKEVKEINEQVQFSKLTSDIQKSIACLIHTSGTIIQTDFSDIDIITSFRSYLYSIFYNLITNSIKYRKPDVQSLIFIQSKQVDGKVKLIFSDNGLGFNIEKKREEIFMLYKRFHNHVEGKGMGLFMTKTQVESLGGKIDIESKLNEGTQITITL